MGYVTDDYYKSVFKGEPVISADFPSLCLRASEIVEEMTMYRLNETTYRSMSEHMQDRIKKAVCAQIEYLDANGGAEMDTGIGLQGASLGKFSYAAGTSEAAMQSIYAPRALRMLIPTGLLNRGGKL